MKPSILTALQSALVAVRRAYTDKELIDQIEAACVDAAQAFNESTTQSATIEGLRKALADCIDRLNHHDAQSVPEVVNAKAALDGVPESAWPYVTPGMELRALASTPQAAPSCPAEVLDVLREVLDAHGEPSHEPRPGTPAAAHVAARAILAKHRNA